MFGGGAKIFLTRFPTDMRKGFEGLYEIVRHKLEMDPRSGHLFLFTNQRRNRLKVLHWDGSGLWLCSKRLEKGNFHWPKLEDKNSCTQMSAAHFAMLVSGIDLQKSEQRRWYRLDL